MVIEKAWNWENQHWHFEFCFNITDFKKKEMDKKRLEINNDHTCWTKVCPLIDKHVAGKGCKTISEQLDVPVAHIIHKLK